MYCIAGTYPGELAIAKKVMMIESLAESITHFVVAGVVKLQRRLGPGW